MSQMNYILFNFSLGRHRWVWETQGTLLRSVYRRHINKFRSFMAFLLCFRMSEILLFNQLIIKFRLYYWIMLHAKHMVNHETVFWYTTMLPSFNQLNNFWQCRPLLRGRSNKVSFHLLCFRWGLNRTFISKRAQGSVFKFSKSRSRSHSSKKISTFESMLLRS